MLQTIGYRLGSPAAIHFLRRFSKLNQVGHENDRRARLAKAIPHPTNVPLSQVKLLTMFATS